jgi:CRP-like cAMP-binding protein
MPLRMPVRASLRERVPGSSRRETMASSNYPFGAMARRLGGPRPLPATDRDAIQGLPFNVRSIEASQDIVYEGGPSTHCCVILDGWTCCYQLLTEGRRQILSFHVPGDLPDLQSLYLIGPDFGMAAVTRTSVAFVPHAELQKLADQSTDISRALWREALVAAATHRAWITSLGRRDARQRLAHLICELYLRLETVGLAGDHSMPMPLRQPDLADALGLTSVHVNRTLKGMRAERLIDLHSRRLTIHDWDALRIAADFDPLYLHLDG